VDTIALHSLAHNLRRQRGSLAATGFCSPSSVLVQRHHGRRGRGRMARLPLVPIQPHAQHHLIRHLERHSDHNGLGIDNRHSWSCGQLLQLPSIRSDSHRREHGGDPTGTGTYKVTTEIRAVVNDNGGVAVNQGQPWPHSQPRPPLWDGVRPCRQRRESLVPPFALASRQLPHDP